VEDPVAMGVSKGKHRGHEQAGIVLRSKKKKIRKENKKGEKRKNSGGRRTLPSGREVGAEEGMRRKGPFATNEGKSCAKSKTVWCPKKNLLLLFRRRDFLKLRGKARPRMGGKRLKGEPKGKLPP